MEGCSFSSHEELERYVDELFIEPDRLAWQALSRILELIRSEDGTAEN